MRLWTIQPISVWEQLQEDGHVYVDETRRRGDGYVPYAFRWLVHRLTERIPDYPGTLPWWAYCEKPDLRLHRHSSLPGGRHQVRLEIEPRPGTFLAFPLWAWHTVFREGYLSPTREEADAWRAAFRRAVPDEDLWPPPEPWWSELQAAWHRLFDPDLPPLPWDPEEHGRYGEREAVLGVLRLEEVRAVTPFTCASR